MQWSDWFGVAHMFCSRFDKLMFDVIISLCSDLTGLACLGLQDEGVEFLAKKEGSSTRAASKSLDLYYETHFWDISCNFLKALFTFLNSLSGPEDFVWF